MASFKDVLLAARALCVMWGACHAICQLYKKLEVSSHQVNFKTNDLVLSFKTI